MKNFLIFFAKNLFSKFFFSIIVASLFFLYSFKQTADEGLQSYKTFLPDTAISGVELIHWKTLVNKFEDDTSFVMQRIAKHKNYDFPFADFINDDKTQVMLLYVHPTLDLHDLSICELKVMYNADYKKCGCVQFPDDAYETSLGIKLGMNLKQVRNIVGKPTLKFQYQDEIVLEYKEMNKESPFLKRYHQPAYFAYYRFRNDSLKIIHFGFDTH